MEITKETVRFIDHIGLDVPLEGLIGGAILMEEDRIALKELANILESFPIYGGTICDVLKRITG